MVRAGDLLRGERGGGDGRDQGAGEAQGAERGGEGGAPLQGGAARVHALLDREARVLLQGRGAGAPQPPRAHRCRVPLRARLRRPPPPRRRRRRRRPHPRRLRRSRRRPGRRRRRARPRRRRDLRRLPRPRRLTGVRLKISKPSHLQMSFMF